MEKKDERLEEQVEKEEDLLDFSLDDLTPEDAEKESAASESEEEIIELVNLVKEGEKVQKKGDEEVEELLVEDQSTEAQPDMEGPTKELPDMGEMAVEEGVVEPATDEVDVSDISLELDMTEVETPKPEEKVEEEEIPGSEIEKMLEEEPTEWEEPSAEAEERFPQEEIREELASHVEYPEAKKAPIEPSGEDSIKISIGISEEKIEAILTKVIQDVVERVTRETMINVAERVIRGAIDDLKQSLETTSD